MDQVVVIPLECAHSVSTVVRRLARRSRLTAWSGAWAGGSSIVTCDPLRHASTIDAFDELPAVAPHPDHPDAVGGGWFGYLGYPGGPSSLAFYDHLLRHDGERWFFESVGNTDALDGLLRDLDRPYDAEPARLTLRRTPHRTSHLTAVEKAIQAIRRGDIFQANICTVLDLTLTGSPYDAWCRLTEQLRPARSALVVDPAGTAISASPELFLRRKGNEVLTAPIKGTRPRVGDDDEATILGQSSKDAAENVMIVDLMRNDLSRVCEVGSVTVPRLLSVEPHPGVWHLVSYVHGTVADELPNAELIRAAFPPGSVTGAPKLRAQQIIDEVESTPRGIYTGALGFASPIGGLELSVAIRTFEVRGQEARLGVGGGVTADSTPVEEWLECQTKAAPLLTTLGAAWRDSDVADAPRSDPARGIFETLLIIDHRLLELADHVSRLRRSFWECYRVPLTADVVRTADDVARTAAGCWRARIVAHPARPDQVEIEPEPCDPPYPLAKQPGLSLRVSRISGAGLDRHKYVDRAWLTRAEDGLSDNEAVLFVAAHQVLETSRANVFAVIEGALTTPPLDGRILPGVTRQVVLDLADDLRIPVAIADLTLADLHAADAVFLTNAVRGLQWVRAVGGRSWSEPGPIVQLLSERLLARWI